jgi:hypothetical protein
MTPLALAEKIETELIRTLDPPLLTQLLMGTRPKWTAKIKKVMGDLGKSLQYGVAASGYSRAKQGEFLYDMVWYQLNRGFVLRQPMVMEVEYAISHTNTVDYDFQKLVQARADVRVWITPCANSSVIDLHVANCEEQIRLFRGHQVDDQYVLFFFVWDTKTCVVRRLP